MWIYTEKREQDPYLEIPESLKVTILNVFLTLS